MRNKIRKNTSIESTIDMLSQLYHFFFLIKVLIALIVTNNTNQVTHSVGFRITEERWA